MRHATGVPARKRGGFVGGGSKPTGFLGPGLAGMNDLFLFSALIVALIDSFCHVRLAKKIDAFVRPSKKRRVHKCVVFFLRTLKKNVIIDCVNSAGWVLYASGRFQWEFYLQCGRA